MRVALFAGYFYGPPQASLEHLILAGRLPKTSTLSKSCDGTGPKTRRSMSRPPAAYLCKKAPENFHNFNELRLCGRSPKVRHSPHACAITSSQEMNLS